jgi:O-antigen ligase
MTFALFSLWTFILFGRPQDSIPILAPLRPALLLGVLTLAPVLFGSAQKVFQSIRSMPEARKYLIFFGIMIVGIAFADYRRWAFDFIFNTYLRNVLFFLTFVTLVDSVTRLKRVLWCLTVCAAFYSVFGLFQGVFFSGRFFIFGSMFDPNDLAYVLVSLLPLSLFFIVRREGGIKKIVSVVVVGTSIMMILLTGSRAGFLGLATVLLLTLLTKTGSIKISYKIALVAGIALILMFNFEKINTERYLSLTDISDDYNVTSDTGRVEVWTQAYQLLLTNPLTGVGADCFAGAIGYLRADAGLPPVWQTTHNSYLQVAVETGLVGFAFFLSLIMGSVRNFSRCRAINPIDASGIDRSELITAAGLMQLSFAGHLLCAFFLSQAYSLFFTLFFGLSAVMRRLAAIPAAVEAPQIHRSLALATSKP